MTGRPSEAWRQALASALPEGDPAADALLERLNRIGLLEATVRGVAHEVRNPLQAVSMAASAMGEGDADEPLLRHLAQVVVESAGTLEACVDRLVLAAYRRPTSAPEPVSIREVAQSCARIPRAPGSHDLHFAVEIPLDLPAVLVPPGAVQLALLNVLVNAVEAGPDPDQPVVLDAAVEGSNVRLTVGDTGSGVPPAAREEIFGAFVTTKEADGHLGLGLTMARRYARQWGGDVVVDDAGEWGTRMALTMPVAG